MKTAYVLEGTRFAGFRIGRAINFDFLSDITYTLRKSRDANVRVIGGVGGTQHHLDSGGTYIVLPGDTWYPKGDHR